MDVYQTMFISGVVLTLVILPMWLATVWYRHPSARAMRHHRYQLTAQRILARLPTLASDGARLNYLRKINPYVFEELLLLAFERLGIQVIRNRSYSGDGGLDGQVFIAGRRYLIQAKRYRRTITPGHIAAFSELLRREQCPGLFIHTGRTGQKSYANLKSIPAIQLISGQRLLNLLSGHYTWFQRR